MTPSSSVKKWPNHGVNRAAAIKLLFQNPRHRRLRFTAWFVRFPHGKYPIHSGYFRFNVTLANGDGIPDLSTLSIVHDQASPARSYANVL